MPIRLLVASLGNPGPYTNTLHSAGHTLIEALRVHLAYPPFSRDGSISPGLISRGDQFVLYQSPAYMNASGPVIAKAYTAFLRDLPRDERSSARLVIVHDELESQLGQIKVKVGGSAKGHNGLKSCASSLGNDGFTKIGIGIGRPESRVRTDVSSYVLRRMKSLEADKIREGASYAAVALQKICAM